jgi:penicillin-insensitive murein endopeptidase
MLRTRWLFAALTLTLVAPGPAEAKTEVPRARIEGAPGSKTKPKRAEAKRVATKTAPKAADEKKVDPKAAASKKTEPKATDAKKVDAKKTDKAEPKSDKLPKGALSIGAPNRGRLQGAVRLKGSAHLKNRAKNHSWGHPHLVKALKRVSDRVASKHKGSVLLVGDLSSRGGGRLEGHNSHQTGRDADLGYYATNSKGVALPLTRFVAFDAKGKARDGTSALFDDARNWTMVEAFLKDEAQVRYLFVAPHIKARLLAHATKKGVAREVLTKAASVLLAPRDADPHDDHVHVRIACPKGSPAGVCFEESIGGEAAPAIDAKQEKQEPAKQEPAKQEPAKQEPAKQEPAKQEPASTEPPARETSGE